MADEVAEFWSDFEKETGEKVVARSEGWWYRVPDSGMGHEGLLILTDKSLRFKYIPNTKSYAGMGVPPEVEEPTEFTLARGDIVSVRLTKPKRGFLAWFGRRAAPRNSVVARDSGGARTYEFSADPSSGLIAALARAWPVVGPEQSARAE